MTTTAATLGQIAIDCGFADQAHFNRHFRKHLDVSPGRWRRMQALTWTDAGSTFPGEKGAMRRSQTKSLVGTATVLQ